MGVSQDTLNRAIAAAHGLEAQGYFERVRQGDQRAASYFARLTAYTLNPLGHFEDYGCLSKSPGETQVEGFAEDAICYGDDAFDRQNVVDLINGAGAQPPYSSSNPAPSIGGAVKERRPGNLWVKPEPLSAEQLAFLKSGGMPAPGPHPPSTIPSYEAMGGDEGGKKVTRLMEADYKSAGKAGLDGDSGAWQWRTAYDFIAGKFKSVEESIAAHQPEWRKALNDERVSQGKPPIAW